MQPQQPQNNQPPQQQDLSQQIATTLGVAPVPTAPTTYVVTQPVQTFAAIPEKKSPLTTIAYVVLGVVMAGSAGLLAAVIILM